MPNSNIAPAPNPTRETRDVPRRESDRESQPPRPTAPTRRVPTAPAKPQQAIANSEQIAAANKWRKAAIDAGYLTANKTLPKIIAEGETVRNVRARYEKWKDFAEATGERVLAEEIGEPNLEAGSYGPQTIERGVAPHPKHWVIPTNARPQKCKSCDARIFFVSTDANRPMPVNPDGSSHFATCPQADAHRKPRASKPTDSETAYADAKPKMPKHLAYLLAVAGASGLNAQPRGERIENSGVVLLDHGFDLVESWSDLDERAARCLADAITAGALTWGNRYRCRWMVRPHEFYSH